MSKSLQNKKNETNNVFSLNWEIPREKMAENYFKSVKIPDLKCNEDGKESDTSSDSSDSSSDSNSDSSSDDVEESNSSDSNSAGNNIFCVFGVEVRVPSLCGPNYTLYICAVAPSTTSTLSLPKPFSSSKGVSLIFSLSVLNARMCESSMCTNVFQRTPSPSRKRDRMTAAFGPSNT